MNPYCHRPSPFQVQPNHGHQPSPSAPAILAQVGLDEARGGTNGWKNGAMTCTGTARPCSRSCFCARAQWWDGGRFVMRLGIPTNGGEWLNDVKWQVMVNGINICQYTSSWLNGGLLQGIIVTGIHMVMVRLSDGQWFTDSMTDDE